MKSNSEIAFYIADKRHFDYFGNVISELKKMGLEPVAVINDTRNSFKSYPVDEDYAVEMINLAQEKGYTTVSSSEAIMCGRKFQVVVSTFSYVYKVPLGKVLISNKLIKFVAKTIGHWLKSVAQSGLKKRIVYFASDEYSVREWGYPEHLLADKTVFFPKGLDVNDDYPNSLLRDIADVYFCHGNFDRRIMEKNIDKEVYPIGYPRYDRLAEKVEASVISLQEEFDMDRSRPLICWLPTFFRGKENIMEWLPHFESLVEKFNVLVRPHPKQLELDASSLLKKLSLSGLFIDQLDSRDMTKVYAESHLVCCDYGGTIFSAIYTNADLFLLDVTGHDEISRKREKSADILVRNGLFHMTPAEAEKQGGLLKIMQDSKLRESQREGVKQAREDFFGNVSIGEGAFKTANLLFSYLK